MTSSIGSTSSSSQMMALMQLLYQNQIQGVTGPDPTTQSAASGSGAGDSSNGSSPLSSGDPLFSSDIMALLMQIQSSDSSSQGGSTSQTAATGTSQDATAGTAGSSSFDQWFKSIDSNGDGQVSLSEFENARPSWMSQSQADAIFQKLDTGNTGSLSEAQLKSAFHGGHHHGGGDVAALMDPSDGSGSSTDGSSSDGNSAGSSDGSGSTSPTTVTRVNPDGSTTTITTNPDGSTTTSTTPAASANGTTPGESSAQMLAQFAQSLEATA